VKYGDISNELPRRIIVVADVFLTAELTVKKKFKVIPVPQVSTNINRQVLSHFYLFTTRKGVTLEVVSFDMSEDELSKLMDRLDNMGTNPFRYFASYSSVDHLVAELPYRPEVEGVIDVPTRQLRYGHWGMDNI
jgi:hypothetical protein